MYEFKLGKLVLAGSTGIVACGRKMGPISHVEKMPIAFVASKEKYFCLRLCSNFVRRKMTQQRGIPGHVGLTIFVQLFLYMLVCCFQPPEVTAAATRMLRQLPTDAVASIPGGAQAAPSDTLVYNVQLDAGG